MMYLTPQDNISEKLSRAAPGERVALAAGDYRCKLLLTTPGLTIQGAGQDKTRILWDDYAKKPDSQGREYNTFRTWTVAVCAPGVTMEDLAIANTAGAPESLGQEVALTVYADNFHMERCTLSSTQDTLFLGPLPKDLIQRYEGFLPDLLRRDIKCRQSFRRCRVEGTVDFIFGCGEAVFDRCELRFLKDARDVGYLAAPAHALEQEKGFLFQNCDITAESGVPAHSVYLARPWRDYGLCAFENCRVSGDFLNPLGFDKWNDTNRDRTARFYETPAAAGRVPWVKG